MKGKKALVVGGGIAGLAMARALRGLGTSVEIIERVPAWAPLGAGIVLSVNAMKVLRSLDLREQAEALGRPIREAAISDHMGRALGSTDLGSLQEEFGPSLAFHRADLHELLLTGVSDVPLRLGTTLRSLETDPERCRVVTSDGQEAEYDLVVGADGVRSQTREILFAGVLPIYAGYTCWRIVVECPPGLSTFTEMWGDGQRFGLVPLTRERLYAFAVANAPPASAGDPPERFRKRFSRFGGFVPRVLEQVTRPEQLLHNDLEEVRLDRWFKDSAVLIGDAAHATTPNMGQGAAMALEDVYVLRDTLAQQASLADFQKRREPRVRFVQNQSRRIGALGQWQGAFRCRLRNALLRTTPNAIATRALHRLAAAPI